METTKITVKVFDELSKSFHKKLDDCFIKRDAYLNYVIKSETEHLAKEMHGLKLSKPARRFISGELKKLGTKTINVVVDKDTALKLNEVVSESNLVRDSFINRLILFLNASDKLLENIGIPTQISDRALFNAESMPTSPLQSMTTMVSDPLYYLRTAVEERYGEHLYRYELPEQLFGMSCYLDDAFVPGTSSYKVAQEKQGKLSDLMKLIISPLGSEEDIKDVH